MRKLFAFIIAAMMVLGMFALFGCKEPEPVYVYICANGKEVSSKQMCGDAVSKNDAENYAKRYVSAFFTPYGGKAQLVSSYLDMEINNYFATFVVADRDGMPYETIVEIDGVTGKVNCTEKCDYN